MKEWKRFQPADGETKETAEKSESPGWSELQIRRRFSCFKPNFQSLTLWCKYLVVFPTRRLAVQTQAWCDDVLLLPCLWLTAVGPMSRAWSKRRNPTLCIQCRGWGVVIFTHGLIWPEHLRTRKEKTDSDKVNLEDCVLVKQTNLHRELMNNYGEQSIRDAPDSPKNRLLPHFVSKAVCRWCTELSTDQTLPVPKVPVLSSL